MKVNRSTINYSSLRMHVAAFFVLALSTPSNAQSIQSEPPRPSAKIFAAACATCHGQSGLGGTSWVIPGRNAPRIAKGISSVNQMMEQSYRKRLRNGSAHPVSGLDNAMPTFGPSELSDIEMDALIRWLIYRPPLGAADPTQGVPRPERPLGHEIVVRIIDEAPWYQDDGSDARDPFSDTRRVVLSEGDYLKVVNLGKTWHTVSKSSTDTGFIGPSNLMPGQEVGYYYLTPQELQTGAERYFCKLHPYMQLEIVQSYSEPMMLTSVTKLPLATPASRGIGDVWVGLQAFHNPGGHDGAVAVIDASSWMAQLIPSVGNNPHNGWFGTALDPVGRLREIVTWVNWHDVGVTFIDAKSRQVLGTAPVGAANAHVMTSPKRKFGMQADRWFVSIMGSNKIQEFQPFELLAANHPTLPAIAQANGENGKPAMSPHGIWFTDDGDHILTANTLAGSVSVYSISVPWQENGYAGIGKELGQVSTDGLSPLSVSVFNTRNPNSRRYRAFCNNAGTNDISVLDIDLDNTLDPIQRTPIPPPLGNSAGNIALADNNADPVRWAMMPIQSIVSPPDSTTHGRYLVVCNKASMNVSIISLSPVGEPQAIYTFPAGLGAHGVAFGRKRTSSGRSIGYYAYVANTFENYVSVYDLELLEQMVTLDRVGLAPPAFRPGGATETVAVSGYAAEMLSGHHSTTAPITLFSPDARGVVHVGDVLLPSPPGDARRAYLKEHVWIETPGMGMTMLDLDLNINTGAMGIFARPLGSPWSGK